MTREEAIDIFKHITTIIPSQDVTMDDVDTALAMAISALKQEPWGDAISREAVKELIKCGVSTDTYDDVEQVCKWIDALPSVTQKSGKWIPHSSGIWIEYYECSECGRGHTIHSDFCPNCGAKMVEPQESGETKETIKEKYFKDLAIKQTDMNAK